MSRYPGEYMSSKFFLAQNGEKTFQHDNDLPPLPVPALRSTMDKYLESVRPHLSPTEFNKTETIVADFVRGDGPKLQKMLEKRGETHKNWLDDWWLSYAYMKLRIPIVPLMNVCGIGPYFYHIWPPMSGTQLPRNALSLYFLLTHWQHMRREEVMSDSGRSGKEPWSMNQFRHLYNACRSPGLEEDNLHVHFKTVNEGSVPTHLAVLCNKRIYTMDVLSPQGELYTPPQLEKALTEIKRDAYSKGEGIGLSTLTSENRTTWYHLREHLISLSPVNKENLELIQSAVIGNSLVEESPLDNTQAAQQGLTGKPGNVWYDKSYNSIWFANGITVSNCDHAPMDAMTSVGLCYYADCKLIECGGVWGGNTDTSVTPPYKELVFTVDDKILGAIDQAETSYMALCNNMEIINPSYGGFGKKLLKQNKIHPDTFVQVCLQYAYYKIHGKPAPTYETATTRKFYNGRTETVRSCTNEAIMFAKTMLDPKATTSHKLQLFRQATNKHLAQMRYCMSGQGIDRHLLGLKVLCLENNLPVHELFSDPAFQKSGGDGNFILSTSFIGFTSVHGGVAPMCQNGYGCFYRMGDERMIFWLTSWKSDKDTSAVKLYNTIIECMEEVMGMIRNHTPASM